jgi:phosphoribosylanthranilate isomerase
MGVRVKICGVTRVEDAIAAVDAGADLIGLNFYPPSPRHVCLARALEIRRAIDGRVKLAALFVDITRELAAPIVKELAPDFVQLYGDADEATLADGHVPLIRAFRLKPGTSGLEVRALVASTRAEYVLLDAYDPKLYGGSGIALDLEDLAGLDLTRAFIAGGLRPETVAAVAKLGPYGVDVASGVESAPGVKDHHKLRSFIRNAKSAR